MKKNEERDEVISKKLAELEKKKSKLQEKLEALGKRTYKTNLKVVSDSGKTYNLRVITDLEEIINVFSLISAKKEWVLMAAKELGLDFSEPKIFGYPYEDWKEDFKAYIEKLETQEELNKIEEAISKLPKFYTDDKRDEDEFEKLIGEL